MFSEADGGNDFEDGGVVVGAVGGDEGAFGLVVDGDGVAFDGAEGAVGVFEALDLYVGVGFEFGSGFDVVFGGEFEV